MSTVNQVDQLSDAMITNAAPRLRSQMTIATRRSSQTLSHAGRPRSVATTTEIRAVDSRYKAMLAAASRPTVRAVNTSPQCSPGEYTCADATMAQPTAVSIATTAVLKTSFCGDLRRTTSAM